MKAKLSFVNNSTNNKREGKRNCRYWGREVGIEESEDEEIDK